MEAGSHSDILGVRLQVQPAAKRPGGVLERGQDLGGPHPSPHHPQGFGISFPFPEQRGGCSRMLPGDWGGIFSQGGDTDGSRIGTVIPGATPMLILLLSRLFLGSPRCSWEAEAALPVARPDPHGWHWGQSAWPGKHQNYGRHWDHGRQFLGSIPSTPSSYLVGAEAGGPAPEIGGGHGDAEFQDGEGEQHDGNPIPCELQDGQNPISTRQEHPGGGIPHRAAFCGSPFLSLCIPSSKASIPPFLWLVDASRG